MGFPYGEHLGNPHPRRRGRGASTSKLAFPGSRPAIRVSTKRAPDGTEIHTASDTAVHGQHPAIKLEPYQLKQRSGVLLEVSYGVVQDDGTCRATTHFELCISVPLIRIPILPGICCSYSANFPGCPGVLHKPGRALVTCTRRGRNRSSPMWLSALAGAEPPGWESHARRFGPCAAHADRGSDHMCQVGMPGIFEITRHLQFPAYLTSPQ